MDQPANTKIYSVQSREILDSRSNPTIEVSVFLESGYRGVASVPSGASVGKYEVIELRDNDPNRYNGKGVLNAVKNVNTVIAPELKGMDSSDQASIDNKMKELDGTPNKSKLGGNSILGVSLASAAACASAKRIPLYRWLSQMFSPTVPFAFTRIPTPLFNVINGGKHGAGNLDFQEFHIIPASNRSFHEALRMGSEVYQAIKKILTYRNVSHSVGDEGGFAPNLFTNLDALVIILEALKESPYQFGVDVFLGLDVAAAHFKSEKGYQIKDRAQAYDTNAFIAYLKMLHKSYRLLLLEDPLDEDDWNGWIMITKEMSNEVLIVGDDLLVTNAGRLKEAIEKKACTAILLKPNQVGTLTEFFECAHLAKEHNVKCILSHRSGETNDTFIADLAVAIQADYVKFGAPARGERVAKYNRLLEIETMELSQKP